MRRSERDLLATFAGMTAVTATYVFFLIYAQFGFLHLLELRLGTGGAVRPAMAAMGLAGLAASIATALLLRRVAARQALIAGLMLCAGAGLVSLVAQTSAALVTCAALVGGSTAVLTVSLASSFRDFVGSRHTGLVAGVATGVAYFVCNVPSLFEGSPSLQAAIAAAVCGLAAVAVALAPPRSRHAARESEAPPLPASSFFRAGFAAVVLAFLALVWLDSAAFRIIQETAALKGVTWGSENQKLLQGLVHLFAAVMAGHLIDRGRLRALLVGAWALFAVSFVAIEASAGWIALVGPLYAIGISAYSTALVVYPSLRGDEAGLVPRRWRAGLLYGVAGWIGSALGVGMAQDLHGIPHWFLAASGIVVVGSMLSGSGASLRRVWGAAAIPLAFAAAAVAFYSLHQEPRLASSVARGREVYVSEGCVNCHSQYVRPGTHDELLWGPYRPIDRTERPPLVGNRRQGPDLLNVALRRSREWNRIHLIEPRSLSPGSRMPSYAHLFADGDSRGDDLVAYLDTLGAEDAPARLRTVSAWRISDDRPPDSLRGRALFSEQCAVCHGPEAKGDGRFARLFVRERMNLQESELRSIRRGAGAEPEAVQLARVVKFGLAPSPMPGHETMSDRDVADIVAFLQTLRAGPFGVSQLAERSR